jgi:hypothetical protein
LYAPILNLGMQLRALPIRNVYGFRHADKAGTEQDMARTLRKRIGNACTTARVEGGLRISVLYIDDRETCRMSTDQINFSIKDKGDEILDDVVRIRRYRARREF